MTEARFQTLLLARRARLAAAVKKLAIAIAEGECTPSIPELRALALICDEAQLYVEAARVRCWLAVWPARFQPERTT